jgi:hypothetical protein
MNDFVEDCIVKYKWGEQTFFLFSYFSVPQGILSEAYFL